MKRFRVKKDVVIYHPDGLVIEKDSVLRCNSPLFGVIGKNLVMSEFTHPKEFVEHFEELKEATQN